VGDPAENAAAYSQAGADELVFLDITATIENRKTLLDAVRRTVERISVPLTVGGGISSCQGIEELLAIGVSKVSMNTAAVRNPDLVREAADEFGSEKITVAIDTAKNPPVWTPSSGPGKSNRSAPGPSFRPAWTPTAGRPATTSP
jgi:cyclase